VVVSRFDEHVETQQLLPILRSAYRATYSIETAAVHDSIVRTIDSGDVCALVLHDPSSAFDTVDYMKHLCMYYSSVLESRAQL